MAPSVRASPLNTEGSNPNLENIEFYNNVWSDPTDTMGATAGSNNDDFSDTPPGETDSFALDTNLYYNGVDLIPLDGAELINYTNDSNGRIGNPQIPSSAGLILPRWQSGSGNLRDQSPDLGAVEASGIFTDDFESSNTGAWSDIAP